MKGHGIIVLGSQCGAEGGKMTESRVFGGYCDCFQKICL